MPDVTAEDEIGAVTVVDKAVTVVEVAVLDTAR